MFTTKSRILFLGHFGSGKTEVAINCALKLARSGRETSLVDLDLVTPYFRSREVREPLEAQGLRVIGPDENLCCADLPVLPMELVTVVTANQAVVFDVGGDEGARAIADLTRFLPPNETEVLMVVNARRPLTARPEQVLEYMGWFNEVSRLRVTGLVNNTNVGPLTTPEDVKFGHDVLEEVSRESGVPVVLTTVSLALAQKVDPGLLPQPLWTLQLFMRPPWEYQ